MLVVLARLKGCRLFRTLIESTKLVVIFGEGTERLRSDFDVRSSLTHDTLGKGLRFTKTITTTYM